jgi:hypothetical protein
MSRKNRRITNRGSHLPKVSVTVLPGGNTVKVSLDDGMGSKKSFTGIPNKESDIMMAVRKIRGVI